MLAASTCCNGTGFPGIALMARITVRFGSESIVISGVIAGIVFIVFEMLAAAAQAGAQAAAMPLRMIAAIVLGRETLEPSYSLATVVTTGMAVHLVLSVVFAAICAVVIIPLANRVSPGFAVRAHNVTLVAVAFAIALWLVNVYVVAPAAGWTWFATRTDPLVQVLAHVVCFGWPMGWMLEHSTGERTLTI
jgi:hypothetical protein